MQPKKTFISNWANILKSPLCPIASGAIAILFSPTCLADTNSPIQDYFIPYQIIVNSAEDGDIKPDDRLTLREAIALANNNLSRDKLTSLEQLQVEVLKPGSAPKIHFNLPSASTTIYLQKTLPELRSPRLVIDGTTQSGYNSPVVAITPNKSAEVPRGLTIVADGIAIKGLALYGFAAKDKTLPSGDIFISHRLPPPDTSEQTLPADYLPFYFKDVPPKDIVISDNWLGVKPDKTVPLDRSDFGVYVFNSLGTKIERNIIAEHAGSGIVTSVRAENLVINNNKIANNGVTGMPDGIRLEGFIYNTKIFANSLTNNGGSGIYIFKPEGSVEITKNYLKGNGKRLRKAAIYVTGNNHKIAQNIIINQPAAGVVIASYPRSRGNVIRNNRFANLEGLSIDLNTQDNVGVRDWERGDGVNPDRDSRNRRLDTGNAAINAPKFLAKEFYIFDGKVNLDGIADPGAVIEVYLTKGDRPDYNPLFKLLKVIRADKEGKFSLTLSNLKPGDRLSATATDPKYGTSEPALNVAVKLP